MKTIYTVLMLGMMSLAAAGAWAGAGAVHGDMQGTMDLKQYDVRFRSLDTDGDGALSWDEYHAHFTDQDRNIFNALDTNKDGKIEQVEWHNFKAAHGMAGPGQSGMGKGGMGMGKGSNQSNP